MTECATTISLLSIVLPFRLHDALLWESTCHPGKHGTVLTTLDRKPRGDFPPIPSNIIHLCAVTLTRLCPVKIPVCVQKCDNAKTVKKNIYMNKSIKPAGQDERLGPGEQIARWAKVER